MLGEPPEVAGGDIERLVREIGERPGGGGIVADRKILVGRLPPQGRRRGATALVLVLL